ncbi:MAG: hypothetical protein ACTIKR_04150 [Advenella sp.]|uniref:hypothetical protein n=1 Tax=Advenella sp. TaxID=1872388 RepID=UPI003F9C4381
MNVPQSHLFQERLLKMCLTTALLVAVALMRAAYAAPDLGAAMSHTDDVASAPIHTGPGTLESTLIAPASGAFDRVLTTAVTSMSPDSGSAR